MQLERQFAGPLQDTLVQRWRDPADGTICYIYLPITAEHSPPTQSGYVQYGANHWIDQLHCCARPSTDPRSANERSPARERTACSRGAGRPGCALMTSAEPRNDPTGHAAND
jgi:hypothetical protein